ncbi:C25 family cysteine peptidase [Pontibacter silvestris]|uniref:C25 family cysteine peptidase n=1 Tax=Pontibacter silvestris TaxID=2305183 RepID=A0ABW4WUP6_9BACT|nr:C25 family cysteine peptidase [Pontibacter silvestris]MCC9136285.1 C25 family cysteine peptidase [Pontibacter silvestris]
MHTILQYRRFFISFSLLLLSLAGSSVQAQNAYGNEWINYSQTYYKIRIAETGLYKLDYDYLSNLGLANINPQNLQLYRRGKEVAIYIAGESDGKLDTQDYIEFFGEKNDGALDQELYKNPADQVHQLRSLYTDTAAYFLTYAPERGKRMRETNPAVNGRIPESYHLQKAVTVLNETYFRGKLYGENAMPWMDQGEGYMSNRWIGARSYSITGIKNIETSGPKPVVEFATVGAYQEYHTLDVNVTSGGTTRKLKTYQYDFFAHEVDKQIVNFSEVANGQVTLQIVPVSTTTKGNAISFAYGIVTYPQKPLFTGNPMVLYTDSTRSTTPYFEFGNIPATTVAYDVTNLENIVRTLGYDAASNRGYVIRAEDGRTHKILLADASKALTPPVAKRISFRNINPAAHNYIVLTNKRLMQQVGDYTLPAPKAYAEYRASEAGGNYDTLLVFIDDIVNQFHYGEHSANAVRHFLSFMSSSSNAKQLFIIGKGLEYDRINYRSSGEAALDLVPTGGVPASDVFFSADFRNNSFVPQVPTGRIPATSASEVMNYLDKVKEYESQPQGLAWRKNILQLGGGKTVSEINTIASYLSSYKNIASGPLLDANVIEKYRKNVSEAVEVVNVAEEVNTGLSLITFFGHSSTSITDLDIGFVSRDVNGYKNKGKYPVMLLNGCNIGNAFIPNSVSFGEDWVITPNRGAIAFIASTDYGYPSYLHLYTSNFYTASFQNPETYGSSIGNIQKEVIRKVKQTSSNDMATAVVLNMLLQGDPAIKLYSPEKPDYYIKENAFSIKNEDGSAVTASSPKFILKVNVGNLGKVITESVSVKVNRTLADQTTVINYEPFVVNSIQSHDTIRLEIDNEGVTAIGMNSFEVTLDGLNEIEELDESNNAQKYQYYFPSSNLLTLSPSKYGIVNSNKVKLVAQGSTNQITGAEYYFELDTTQAFNSNLKQSYTANSSLLPTWEVTLPSVTTSDSTVYYWRARFNTFKAEEDTVWAESSFRYVPNGKSGWSQSHYGQFDEVQTDKVTNTGKENIKWTFDPVQMEIAIRTAGGNIRFEETSYGLFINGKPMVVAQCSNPAGSATPRVYLVAIDNKSLTTVSGVFSSGACSYMPELYEFGDMRTVANRIKLENFLKAVPDGYYVAAIGINAVPYGSFTAELKNAFKSIGSEAIDNLQNGYPFAIVGQKGGTPGTANELTASLDDELSPLSQDISLQTILSANQQSGTVTSAVIGPALNWGTLYHNVEEYKGGEDEYTLSVTGIDTTGQQEVLVEKVNTKAFDLSAIDAKTYPKLQLSVFLSDETERTAPQLKEWFVYYDAVPEGVIRPDLVQVNEETLSEQADKGSLSLPMAFENISNTAFTDSLLVKVTLTGNGIQSRVDSFKVEPLTANKTAYFNYTLLTNELEGSYQLSMYVNPTVQQEQYYFNNVYEVPFNVKARLHPILDVAFDGIHIMDGELVAPSPTISITLKDESKGVYLQDPSAMSVIMIDPQGEGQEVPLMSNSEVRYYPADEKNDFKLEYKPSKLEDGVYTVEVKARDVTGKLSGVSPYRISFEVVNESSVTNFYPFPNPFSTKTNFIFTLTGATIPDNFKIQILTVTGKVVKEIMKEEIGPIRIGNNKSEYAWDGTDMYGDKLANGVYLYRVVMSQQGVEDMKHRNTFGDKAFKNGYGKLYILR